jgi:hypothetical protein
MNQGPLEIAAFREIPKAQPSPNPGFPLSSRANNL